MNALPDEADYRENYLRTQAILATDLPAIPLYTRLRIAVGRPDLCNYELDHTANSMVSLEFLNYGTACNP
jgi:ABC-type transport system substrate-binding protein